MIFENIEFFNVAEIDGKRSLCRFPGSVCNALSVPTHDADGKFLFDYHGHIESARLTAGEELRFLADGEISVTLYTEKSMEVTVYCGDFQRAFEHTVPGENIFTYTAGDAVKGVKRSSCNRFAPELWRICLDGEGEVRFLSLRGENVRPPRADQLPRKRMLAYGSSISQGIGAIFPQLGYLSVAAQLLGIDVLNKALGGGCFCEKEMVDYLLSEPADYVYLEAGTNIADRPLSVIEERVGALIDRMCDADPSRPVFVVTPIRAFNDVSSTAEDYLANFARSRKVIEECAARHKNAVLIDGHKLLDKDYYLSSDILHPSSFGHVGMGINLAEMLKKYIH